MREQDDDVLTRLPAERPSCEEEPVCYSIPAFLFCHNIFLCGVMLLHSRAMWVHSSIRHFIGARVRTSIIFHKTGRFEVETGTTILAAAQQLGLFHAEPAAHMACPSCLVWILAGEQNCSPMEAAEAQVLAAYRLQAPLRLACSTRILGPIRAQILLREESEALALMQNPSTIFPALPGTQQPLVHFQARLHGFEALAASSVAFDSVRLLQQFRATYEALLVEYDGVLCEAGVANFFAVFGMNETDLVAACNRALGAARRLSVACKELTEYATRHLDAELHVGIAIHAGASNLGQIGSEAMRQWVVFGETRQIVDRLLVLTESAKASILVSEAIFAVIRERFPISRAFAARLPGKEQRSNVFEVQAQSTGFLAQMAA